MAWEKTPKCDVERQKIIRCRTERADISVAARPARGISMVFDIFSTKGYLFAPALALRSRRAYQVGYGSCKRYFCYCCYCYIIAFQKLPLQLPAGYRAE